MKIVQKFERVSTLILKMFSIFLLLLALLAFLAPALVYEDLEKLPSLFEIISMHMHSAFYFLSIFFLRERYKKTGNIILILASLVVAYRLGFNSISAKVNVFTFVILSLSAVGVILGSMKLFSSKKK